MKKILIVDDHKLIYDGLMSRLSRLHQNFHCLYAPNGDEALQMAHQNAIDIMIVDITLGKENGFDVAKSLKESIEVIFFLTMHDTSSYLLRAFNDGYRGFFNKNNPLDLLIAAVSYPELKPFWAEEELLRKLDNISQEKKDEPYDKLSRREQEIFRLLAEGLNYKEIGFKLNISSKTSSAHRYNILKKLNLKNQAELVHYAMELGIIAIY